MGVTPEIFNGIAESVKGFFDIRAPVFFVKVGFPFPERERIPQMGAGGRKPKGTAFIKRGEAVQELPFEFIPENPDRDKELRGRKAEPEVICEPAAGNDAVHMNMVPKFLVPCMQDLDDARGGTEELLIRG